MDEERAVLLGVIHERQGVDNASPYVCKAGGTPAWYGDAPTEAGDLVCPKCHADLYLVAQVYAPVESDRTLYVFGCNSVACTEEPGSWRVVRDQAEMIKEVSAPLSATVDSVTASIENVSLAWGSGDGGDDSDWSDDDDDEASATNAPSGGGDLVDLELLLQQRDDALSKPSAAIAPAKKKTETKAPVSTVVATTKAFPALPIEVIDEPFEDYTAENDYSHENKLLEEYMRQEDEEKSEDVGSLRKVIDATKKKSAGGTSSGVPGSGESYERTPAHQRNFMRFQKRISRCPLQCLRYDYGGEPLWPTTIPQNLRVPSCACGQERVFELQLTPTINYFLKVDDLAVKTPAVPSDTQTSDSKPSVAAGEGMDWLGLMVYSCPSSCAQSRSEFVYVLPAAST